MNESYVDRINKGMMMVKLAIMKSAKEQIPISYYFKLAKEIFVFLIKYFKLFD